jgi:cytosine/adenosine deaminase-related metal-dependent hydrolase
VLVDGGRIAWAGEAGDPGAPAGTPEDLGSGVLMPGLVNAHTHLELSHLAGQPDASRGFVPWVRDLVARREAAGLEAARQGAAAAIEAALSLGTVAVGDVSNALAHLDLLAASPLRAVVFFELIGWGPDEVQAALAFADARLAALPPAVRPLGLEVRLAAHAPYSVSAGLLKALAVRADFGGLHLAESPEETRFLATGEGEWRAFLAQRGMGHVRFTPPHASPVAYVDGLGALREGVVAAHCVQVNDADCARLARSGVHVALCPRSNRTLGVGRAPLPRLMAAGVRLCLGTDSLASAPSLNLLEDAAALHEAFPEVTPAALVRMATAGGAEALGLPDLGALAPGKSAALAFVPARSDPADPLAYLVSGQAQPRRVERAA